MDETRLMCSRCYNESVAKYLSLNYEHVEFDPITIESPRQIVSVRKENLLGWTTNVTSTRLSHPFDAASVNGIRY